MFKKIACLAFALCLGCRTLPPLPPADLSTPGWDIQQGQALWKPSAGAPEIAGDIRVATHRDGRALVQFSKTPFPLVIAQTTPAAWQIESPVENRRYARPGKPPARFPWFVLASVLAESSASNERRAAVPEPWKWTRSAETWRLENTNTGETLEGFVEPVTPSSSAPR